MPLAPPARSRAARFFFTHLGTLISIVVYVVIAEGARWSVEGVTRALWTALAVQTAYLLLARTMREHKQFDLVVWLLYAVGAAAAALGATSILFFYQRYFGALLFSSFALAAFGSLALGAEPFTVWHAVRQTPRWQHDTPAFADTNRVLTGFWGLVFVGCAVLCAVRPTDPMFTLVYPNLLLIIVGGSSARWLPPLWFRWFPPALPDRAEPIIMGMPFVFDPRAAGDTRALIQFRVTGERPGDYYLRVASGRCESFEGAAPAPDVTVHTPDDVWVRIARGEIDGAQAMMERRYSVEGDYVLFAKLGVWFPSRPV